MATQLFLLNTAADTHLATNNVTLVGASANNWGAQALGTARGSGLGGASSTATVTGPTAGIEARENSGTLMGQWISPPVSADVTISGTITANIWAAESAMTANVAINVIIEIIRANALGTVNSNTLVEIVRSTNTVEVATTTRGVNNFTSGMTSGGYTSQTLNRGDRLRIRVFGDDSAAATMLTALNFNISYSGTTAAADGDTYVTFTETFSFESAPGGSVIYLTDTASDVATASVDREAWTSRGAGVQTDVTNTATGWTAPIQVTDTAGGTVVDWFTKQLTAFTLTGMAVANIRALESVATANASLRCQIARVASDGTSPTVWADWAIAPITTDLGELGTTEAARTCNVSGDDLAFTDGQRIRIRLYVDDTSAAAMPGSNTVTIYYAGTSASASGDTYVTLPQAVTEYVVATFIAEPTEILSQAVNRSATR